MNKCGNCGVSVMDRPLSRVNPLGEKGVFWCDECIQKTEPELFENIKEENKGIVNDLRNICYGKV